MMRKRKKKSKRKCTCDDKSMILKSSYLSDFDV